MGSATELVLSFHGIGVRVTGPAAIISALESRLGELPREIIADPLIFEYETLSPDGEQTILKPSGEGRPFYISAIGEAIYYPDGDLLYMSYGDRARILCRVTEGRCRITLAEPEVEQVWLGTHPLFTIPFLEMLKRRGRYSLHAAAFAFNGRCVLLAGTSGVGKSTLTLCHLQAGMSFMGDDMTFFEESDGIRALAFPEQIDITDATASFFPELQTLANTPRRLGWPKHEVCPTDFFKVNLEWSATPTAIIFPAISVDNRESQLLPIGSNEAFMELASNILLTDATSTKAHVAFLARLVDVTVAYRLIASRDFDYIVSLTKMALTEPNLWGKVSGC